MEVRYPPKMPPAIAAPPMRLNKRFASRVLKIMFARIQNCEVAKTANIATQT